MPIPGNDDAMRAIQLYCDLFAGAVIDGLQQDMVASGVDVGAAEAPPVEALDQAAPEPAAAEVAASTPEAAPAEEAAAPETTPAAS